MKKFSAIALSGVTALCTLCACANKKPNGRSANFFAMDTAAFLVAANVGERQFDGLVTEVSALLYSAENSLSVSRAGSCIYSFNRAAAGATVEIDEICYEALSLAKEVYEQTDGYFNPAVYYCEDLYGFAARPEDAEAMPYDRESVAKELPDGKYITAFRELSEHFAEVEISQSGGKYYATKPDFTISVDGNEYSLALDLGGIAKGLMVDKVNAMIEEAGIEYGYFNFGVSSMGVKAYNGGDGRYSIASYDPRGSGSYATFKMKNANLSTSGDYIKYYVLNDKRYCHIISPQTGKPIETGVASVTIVGGSAGRSDALTTALSAMGKEKAAQFINDNLSDCKVIMLIFEDEDGVGKVLTNAPDYFTITNKNYALANTVEDGKIVLN